MVKLMGNSIMKNKTKQKTKYIHKLFHLRKKETRSCTEKNQHDHRGTFSIDAIYLHFVPSHSLVWLII